MSAVENPRAVATRHDDTPAPPATEAAALLMVIERAATNPAVDLDKLERLLEMQERIVARNAKAAYAEALAAMAPDLPIIAERGGIKDKNGRVQSTYAKWEDINEAIKPVLARHGFALSFRTGEKDGRIVVTGVLSHRAGHAEETTMSLPVDGSGSKNAVQAVGSSTSYGKRYTAAALLNLTSRGEDDDGRAGGGDGPITEEQVAALQKLIDDTGADIARFCRYLKVDALANLPAAHFDAAVKALKSKARPNG